MTTAPVFGYKGLALSASIAALFNAGTLAFLLRRSLGGLELGRVAATLGKVLVAGTAMAATAWGASSGSAGRLAPGPSLAAQVARLGGAIARRGGGARSERAAAAHPRVRGSARRGASGACAACSGRA